MDARSVPSRPRAVTATYPALDAALVTALNALPKRTAGETHAAGAAYEAGLADLDLSTPGDKYVITDPRAAVVLRHGDELHRGAARQWQPAPASKHRRAG